jgi:phosphatidylglycerophosphatase A
VITRLAVFICTFGYIGYFPIAPGTVGSMAGLAVYGWLRWIGAGSTSDAGIIAVLLALGVWSGTHAERYFGTTDPGPGVLDEVVGMLVTLIFAPATWPVALLGFVVFRALDVVKPFPARRCERLPGGVGMMADDVVSAVYSNIIVRLAVLALPGVLL